MMCVLYKIQSGALNLDRYQIRSKCVEHRIKNDNGYILLGE